MSTYIAFHHHRRAWLAHLDRATIGRFRPLTFAQFVRMASAFR